VKLEVKTTEARDASEDEVNDRVYSAMKSKGVKTCQMEVDALYDDDDAAPMASAWSKCEDMDSLKKAAPAPKAVKKSFEKKINVVNSSEQKVAMQNDDIEYSQVKRVIMRNKNKK